jgi:serine/threonine-protein kinase
MSPPNVLITKYGEIKIVDFGLAKANSQLEKSEPGIIKGKFSYLSPEAAMGQDVDARTDIFAVGIILWELLTGQRLFMGETDFQTVKKVQQAQVPSAASLNPQVPPELDRILAKSLTRDPEARYRTARELGQDLSKLMFKLGTPVSAFDIAQIVQTAMKERHRVKTKPQASIIESLIEEALLEFTSLTDEEKAEAEAKETSAARPPSNPGGFVDPTNWADEFSSGEDAAQEIAKAGLGRQLEVGNLSALEDDQTANATATDELLREASGQDEEGEQAAPARNSAYGRPPTSTKLGPAALAMSTADVAMVPPRSGGGAQGIVIAIVVAVVAFGAAWFTHVIPH